MKEQIEQLIEQYQRRIDSCSDVINKTLDRDQLIRVMAKRSCFRTTVTELENILKSEVCATAPEKVR